MAKFRASLFNYLFNTVNVLFAIINGIVMVPLYLNHMPLSTYGAWLASGNVIGLVGVVESGFSGVITQRMAVAHTGGERAEFGRLAMGNFVVAGLMAAFIFLGGLALCPFVPNWVNADGSIQGELRLAIVLSSAATASTILFSLTGAIPQVLQRTFWMGVINSTSVLVGLLTTFLGIIGGMGVVSIALGYLTRSFYNFVALALHVRRLWRSQGLPPLEFSKCTVKSLLRDCSTPFVARLSGSVVNNSQNLIISASLSPASAAVYELTSKVVMVLRMFINMMNGSVIGSFSLIFAHADRNYQKESYRKMATVFFSLLLSGMLFAYLFSGPIVHFWVGGDKFGGQALLGLIVLSALAAETKNFFGNLLVTMGLIKRTAQMDILNSLLFLATLWFLIKISPFHAIPVAILVSSLAFMLAFGRTLSHRFGEKPATEYGPAAIPAVLSVAFLAVALFVLPKNFEKLCWLLLAIGVSGLFYSALLLWSNSVLRGILTDYLIRPLRRKLMASG